MRSLAFFLVISAVLLIASSAVVSQTYNESGGYVSGHQGPPAVNYSLDAGIGLAGLGGVLILYVRAWRRIGKDPKKGTVATQYEAPEGFSPAAVRYLTKMRVDDTAFAAAMINAAAKGAVKIEREDGKYRVSLLDREKPLLAPEEKAAVDALFASAQDVTVSLDGRHDGTVGDAVFELRESLISQFGKEYFATNKRHMLPGVIVSALTLGGLLLADRNWMPLLIVWAIVMCWVCVTMALPSVRRLIRTRDSRNFSLMKVSFFAVFAYVGVFAVAALFLSSSSVFSMTALLLIFINILFYYMLRTTTPKCRQLLDRIEGFRVYLAASETDRLNSFSSPDETPELLQKLVPYAVALNLEHKWSSELTDLVSVALAPS